MQLWPGQLEVGAGQGWQGKSRCGLCCAASHSGHLARGTSPAEWSFPGSRPHPGDSASSCAPSNWGFYAHRCLDASAVLVVSLNPANTSEKFFLLTNLFHCPHEWAICFLLNSERCQLCGVPGKLHSSWRAPAAPVQGPVITPVHAPTAAPARGSHHCPCMRPIPFHV